MFESKSAEVAQNTLRAAKRSGISLHELLKGTLLNDFLGKEITKFSACEAWNIPHQRYDFQLKDDFSFQLEVMQLENEAAMPTQSTAIQGYWELMHLNEDEFVLKLQEPLTKNTDEKTSFLKVTPQNIGWLDNI
ncbi:MAG: hypothetical protein ACPGJS_09490 [Flammeovirgaceae bacterium]